MNPMQIHPDPHDKSPEQHRKDNLLWELEELLHRYNEPHDAGVTYQFNEVSFWTGATSTAVLIGVAWYLGSVTGLWSLLRWVF